MYKYMKTKIDFNPVLSSLSEGIDILPMEKETWKWTQIDFLYLIVDFSFMDMNKILVAVWGSEFKVLQESQHAHSTEKYCS